MSLREREDIVEEIRAHVLDRVSDSGMSVVEVLERLGPAQDLARAYNNGALLRRARFSFSPLLILRAAFAWAMTGVHGMIAFVVALIGYVTGFLFMVAGLMKPFFPKELGLFIGPDEGMVITFRSNLQPDAVVHEVLGPWFTIVCLALGILILIATTILMRKLLPRIKHWRTSALSPGVAAV
jgi:hypothetical protein